MKMWTKEITTNNNGRRELRFKYDGKKIHPLRLEGVLNDYEDRLTGYSLLSGKVVRLETENLMLMAEKQELKNEKELLMKALDDSDEHLESVIEDKKALEDEKQALSTLIDKMRAEYKRDIDELETDLKYQSLFSTMSRMNAHDVSAYQAKIEELEKLIEGLRLDNDDFEEQADRLLIRKKELEAEIDELRADNEKLVNGMHEIYQMVLLIKALFQLKEQMGDPELPEVQE